MNNHKNWITRWIKRFLATACALFLIAATADFCHKQTKGFAVSKIAPCIEVGKSDNPEESKELLNTIFAQSFHYLKKGNSAYVFVSEDQKYILKFIRNQQINPPFWANIRWIQTLFPNYCTSLISKKNLEKEKLLLSYELASEILKNQTGVLYTHLKKTDSLKRNFSLFDRNKVKLSLPSDDVAFVLQKKAEPFCPYFKKLIRQGKQKEAYDLLREFIALLKTRADLGIYDNDMSPGYNLGIFEGHFMTFDLDGLKKCSIAQNPQNFQRHMLHDGRKLILWLETIDPAFACFLEKEIYHLSLCQKETTSLQSTQNEV